MERTLHFTVGPHINTRFKNNGHRHIVILLIRLIHSFHRQLLFEIGGIFKALMI